MFGKKWLVLFLVFSVLLLMFGVSNLAAANRKIVVGVGGWATEDLKKAIQELKFTEKTGIEVEVITRPGSPPEFISQMTSAVMSGTSPYDVIDLEDEAAISFSRADWLENLDPLYNQSFWADWNPDMLEMIKVWDRYKGKLFRVPHNFEAQYFWYRKDLLDQKGLKAPKTWEEMVTVGQKLTNGDVYGVSDALSKGAYLMIYVCYLTKQSGGNIYQFDKNSLKALQFIHDMMYKYKIMPVAALNKDNDALNQDYMNDRVGMMRQWPYFYDVSRGKKEWFRDNYDKIAIALPPIGPSGKSTTYAAAWGWAVPKTAGNKKAALEFVKFITSTENAPKLAKMATWYLNTRKSVMSAVGDQGFAKYLNMYSKAGVIGTRPFHPKFMEATSTVEDLVSSYLTNQISLTELAKRGKERMKALEQSK